MQKLTTLSKFSRVPSLYQTCKHFTDPC